MLGFIGAEKGFTCRVIALDEYKERLRDCRLDIDCIDFGIYGDHLLFRTTSYEPHVGVFGDDQRAIESYRAMHDAAMDSARTLSAGDSTLPVSVTLEQFLNCDTLS